MSLEFIIGPSGAGKTTRMREEILKEAAMNPTRSFIVLVPEQFNAQMQRDMAHYSPNKGIMNVDVLSFARLCHRIFDEAGGNRRIILDDLGKSLVVRRVAMMQNDNLTTLSGQMNKIGYVNEIKSVLSEFMEYDILPENVISMAEKNNTREALSAKLHDLGNIYQGVIDYLGDRYITTEELLDRATDLSDRAVFLKDAQVYLDGYTGFTPVQLRFIKKLLGIVKKVSITVTLGREEIDASQIICKDGEEVLSDLSVAITGDSDLFLLSKRTIKHFQSLANTGEIDILYKLTDRSLKSHRLEGLPMLSYLEESIFREGTDGNSQAEFSTDLSKDDTDIILYEADNMRGEVRNIGQKIHSLVKNSGYKYGEIAILTGDLESYEKYILTELVKYEVPFFIDKRHNVILNPLSEMVSSIIEIVNKDFSYESVIRFLKCGISGFTYGEIDELDNYLIAAGIKRRSKYKKEWTYTPRGYTKDRMLLINELRIRLVEKLQEITEVMPPRRAVPCSELVMGLYKFLHKEGVFFKMNELSEERRKSGDIVRADEYRQVYARLMELLERLMELMRDEPLTVKELGELLSAGLSSLSVGVLPGGKDQVLVGDLERSRPADIKVLFLLGANDGKIPKDARKSGILSELDREILKEQDFELAPGTREQAFIQRYYLYMYLTKPSSRLYVSYSLMDSTGNSLLPSYLVSMLEEMFPAIEVKKIGETLNYSELNTALEGLDMLSVALANRDNITDDFYSLYRYYSGKEEYKSYLKNLIEHAFKVYEPNPIKKAVANALYKGEINGGITRFEQFARCAYAHFVKYGLNLSKRQEYEINTADMGTLFHDSIELYSTRLRELGISWTDIDIEERGQLISDVVDDVFLKTDRMRSIESARESYLRERVIRIVRRTINVLTKQIESGDFMPYSYEKSFREHIDENISLVGRIDRMDIMEESDRIYLRVIDYKSGNAELDLSDVGAGLSLQLPIYLKAGGDILKKEYKGKQVVEAGVFYFHIDDPLVDEVLDQTQDEIDDEIQRRLRLDGAVNGDENIIMHMDRDLSGGDKSDVIPVTLKKDGSVSERSNVVTTQQLREISEIAIDKTREMGERILMGDIAVKPYKKGTGSNVKTGCDYCSYKDICGFEKGKEGYEYEIYR